MSDQTFKSAEQTAQRVLALLVVVSKVHYPERCTAWAKKYNLYPFLSPAELAFVEEETRQRNRESLLAGERKPWCRCCGL